MIKAIGIYRENNLAGKPTSDQKILDLTAEELRKKGFEVKTLNFNEFDNGGGVDVIFTMAKGFEINNILKERKGILILNSPEAIINSLNRKVIYEKMKEMGANIPETKVVKLENLNISQISKKSILKPSNRHEFWFVIETEDDLCKAVEAYTKEKIEEVLIQDFVDGKHVKYYTIDRDVILPKGIESEISNDLIEDIKKQALVTGGATGLEIFGGDFIVASKAYCVDANDWPSFGSIDGFTQEEAAVKIANLIEKRLKQEYVN